MAEHIEIVHQGTTRHNRNSTVTKQNQTLKKKPGKKGILGDGSVIRDQQNYQDANVKKRSKKTRNNLEQFNCNSNRSVHQNSVQNSLFVRPSVRQGTNFYVTNDRKCTAAKWREIVRPLTSRDRARV